MLYKNEGPNLKKGKKAYDIAVVDALTEEKIAWYTGYYNGQTKTLKLYPDHLTDYGKKINYQMHKRTVSIGQVKNFE